MQSTYSSRSLFGCTRISLIGAALFVALVPLRGTSQQPGNSQQPGLSPPESPGMAEHAGTPSPLRELADEAVLRAVRSKNAGMASLTASRFSGTCIDLQI